MAYLISYHSLSSKKHAFHQRLPEEPSAGSLWPTPARPTRPWSTRVPWWKWRRIPRPREGGGHGFAFLVIFDFGPYYSRPLREYFYSPNSLLWGSLLGNKLGRDMLWTRSWSLSACVPLVSALAVPPNVVRLASVMCPPCVRLWPRQTLSGVCPPLYPLWLPQNLSRRVSVRPCVRLALYLPCVSFGRASQHCVPCCPLCPPRVHSLSFLDCALIVRSLFALYLLCRFLAGSMVWLWPGLCQLCVRSLVFVPLSVLCRGLCGCGFARCSFGHL